MKRERGVRLYLALAFIFWLGILALGLAVTIAASAQFAMDFTPAQMQAIHATQGAWETAVWQRALDLLPATPIP